MKTAKQIHEILVEMGAVIDTDQCLTIEGREVNYQRYVYRRGQGWLEATRHNQGGRRPGAGRPLGSIDLKPRARPQRREKISE